MHASLKAMVDNWNAQDERANRVAVAVVSQEGYVSIEDRKGGHTEYEAILVHQRVYKQDFAYYVDEKGKIKQCSSSNFTKRESF